MSLAAWRCWSACIVDTVDHTRAELPVLGFWKITCSLCWITKLSGGDSNFPSGALTIFPLQPWHWEIFPVRNITQKRWLGSISGVGWIGGDVRAEVAARLALNIISCRSPLMSSVSGAASLGTRLSRMAEESGRLSIYNLFWHPPLTGWAISKCEPQGFHKWHVNSYLSPTHKGWVSEQVVHVQSSRLLCCVGGSGKWSDRVGTFADAWGDWDTLVVWVQDVRWSGRDMVLEA